MGFFSSVGNFLGNAANTVSGIVSGVAPLVNIVAPGVGTALAAGSGVAAGLANTVNGALGGSSGSSTGSIVTVWVIRKSDKKVLPMESRVATTFINGGLYYGPYATQALAKAAKETAANVTNILTNEYNTLPAPTASNVIAATTPSAATTPIKQAATSVIKTVATALNGSVPKATEKSWLEENIGLVAAAIGVIIFLKR